MGIPGFFRTPKPKAFNYRPIYYDPVKEERDERNRRIEQEMGVKQEQDTAFKPGIQRGSMRSYYQKNQQVKRASNIRLILIILFLLFVAYWILLR
jgi:uncharacterized membrane protein